MEKEYIKMASVPEDEHIVAMTQYGGFYYWNFKYPFKHYKEPRYLVATQKSIYEIHIK